VVAPDRRGTGTNALLVRPPGLIPYRFGENSLDKHLEEAEAAGAEAHVYESDTLGLDVDIPADLDLYREMLVEREIREPGWLVSL
jgi:2-phospho-L-lactate guanylyltransferase